MRRLKRGAARGLERRCLWGLNPEGFPDKDLLRSPPRLTAAVVRMPRAGACPQCAAVRVFEAKRA
jgi:hypothetical protein